MSTREDSEKVMSIKPWMTGAAGRKYVTLAGLLLIAGALLCVRPAMAQDVKSLV
jgi:hypothetical protein